MTTPYPLAWPDHIPRASRRERGAFKTTLPSAIGNVKESLRLFGNDSGKKLEHVVVSSHCTLGVDRPADPGVAVWFVWDGRQVCIPVDRYETPAANLQAIHHVLEARRVELRHGTLALVRASMQGFLALPAPGASRPWHVVLGVSPEATRAEIEAAHRRLIAEHHPDRGGSPERAAEINAARDQGVRERG